MDDKYQYSGTPRPRYGVDWPAEMSDTFIDLTVAKKWRLMEANGIKVDADPGECLESAITKLFPSLIMSPWTKQMIHDFANHDKYAMIGCGACGKSYAMAACGIAYWIVDPLNTAVIIASATLKDLGSRAWAPTLSLFTELKNNREGVPIPGKIMQGQYAIVNERDETMPETMSVKAAIQGRALDEGRLQGTHTEWICFLVDELGIVNDVEALKTHITNMSIGTLGFKSINAANPNPWDHSNSCFYLPKKGEKVDENSGSWTSSMGYFVRHFDGLQSPVVLDPANKAKYPFLMSKENVDDALDLSGGDKRHPRFYKMVRGFPLTSGTGSPTVLDPIVASQQCVGQPLAAPSYGGKSRVGLAAGVDPAWSEGGDDAIYSGCDVVVQDGRVYLDFTNRSSRLPVSVDSKLPVTSQLRNGVIDRINKDGGPFMDYIFLDSSGNQGLADDLDVYVAVGCGHINNSVRASDRPLRARDPRPAREHIYDRGTEAWCVLAAFCAAGQVRGLPQGAINGLTQRRFATRGGSDDVLTPMRLESKDDFIKRFKGSPNETDACALAALAVKERLGVMPFGGVPEPTGVITGQTPNRAPLLECRSDPPPVSDFGAESAADGFSEEFGG
jgi:hypothetical protein